MVAPSPGVRTPPSDATADPAEEVKATKPDDLYTRTVGGKVYQLPADKLLYSAHGKWEWVNDHHILSSDPGTPICRGLEGHVNLKVGLINETVVIYISKLTSVWDSFKPFFTSLYLNSSSKYLRPLQGDCVPWIIGVHHCLGGRLGVAQDLPHPRGWREADMFLEESQKEAIIAAYQKLHDRGILHGDAEYRHMLLGDDGKVTIIDFGLSCVVNADEGAVEAGLESCSQLYLRTEMRKVKFLLNWKNCRETEFRLAQLRSAREERDAAADAGLKNRKEFLEGVEVPKDPMSEEEREYPDGGLRLRDLELWSHGDTWVARRYEVELRDYKAVLKMTEVPRPPIPAKKTTKSTNAAVSVIPAAEEPIPALAQHSDTQRVSTTSGGATDAPNPTVSPLRRGGPRKLTEEQRVQRMQMIMNAPRHKAAPLRHGKAGGSDMPVMKGPIEDDPEQKQEQKEQTTVDAKFTKDIPLRYGKASESDVLARKRPLETEVEKQPEEQKDDSLEPTRPVPLSHSELPKKPSLNAGAQEKQNDTNIDNKKAVQFQDNGEPARKRLRCAEASVTDSFNPLPSSSNSEESFITEPSSASCSIDLEEDNFMKVPLLDDNAADPTPYELNPEASAFLRREAVRGLARFTTAKTCSQPLEGQLDQENRIVEKRRSELLRTMLMLSKEDRTTLWTNMGQPDARTLLGLLPERPSTSKSARDPIRTEKQLARREAEARETGSSMPFRESDTGLRAVQKAQAKTCSTQKLHERLAVEKKLDGVAMPASPPPVVPSEVLASKAAAFTSSTSPQRDASQEGVTLESSPSTSQGPTCSAPQTLVRASTESEAKRKREVTDSEDSEITSVADGELPDGKRHKPNLL